MTRAPAPGWPPIPPRTGAWLAHLRLCAGGAAAFLALYAFAFAIGLTP